MAASIAVFLGGVSLVGGGFSDRSARFWVTVVSIVFANVVWFNVPIWLVVSDARNQKTFPFQFTAVSFCTLYAAGVFCMAMLVVATPIASGWVVVGHMVLLFFLATSLGVYTMANRSIESMDAMDERAKSGAAKLNLHIRAIADRAQLCEGDGWEEMKAIVADLVDAMHYATGESLPGSEDVEAEITGHFRNIENALMSIDDSAEEHGLEEIGKNSDFMQNLLSNRPPHPTTGLQVTVGGSAPFHI
jgi:hypothetical protein